MNSRERRVDTRVTVKVPLGFRVLKNPGSPEQTAESITISERGILFATAVPLMVGRPLEVSLKMPRELAGQNASDVRWRASSTSSPMRSSAIKRESDCLLKAMKQRPPQWERGAA
jgi:hypothetical protein